MRSNPTWHVHTATPHEGFVKVRLVHAPGVSLIVPDQVYLLEPQVWFHPVNFDASTLIQDDDEIHCRLRCEVEHGVRLLVRFSSGGHVRAESDGSHVYRCVIESDGDVIASSSGAWEEVAGRPHLVLFHHTHAAAHASIVQTSELWASAWNLQGTRKLANVAYVYLTSLPRIRNAKDLAAIAMSPNRTLHFLRDGADPPRPIPPDWKNTPLVNDILEVEVYWSEPEKRNRVVRLLVDPTVIAPHHVLRHADMPVWYEVSCPAILRVGVTPGTTLSFDSDMTILPSRDQKTFDYMVIGDATTLAGLAAPLDEENTDRIFKVHRTPEPPLEFWFSNANLDHDSGLAPELQRFESPR